MKHIAILDMSRPTYYVAWKWHFNTPVEPYGWLEDTPGAGFSFGGNGIYFYSEADATMFVLKWVQ